MEKTHFYILIENRFKIYDLNENNFHIERILTREKAIEILEDESKFYNQKVLRIIVTNESYLLRKYYLSISLEDLKFLCNIKYDADKLKISKNYFQNYDIELYKNFEGVLFGVYLSTTMHIGDEEMFPYEDPHIGIGREIYLGWQKEIEFNYFVTPEKYRNDKLKDNFYIYFQMKNMKVSVINNLFNIDITNNDIWEESKGYYKYYDPISEKRFFIQEELLEIIKKRISPTDLFLSTWAKFDNNDYLEVYAEKISN